LVLEQQLQHQQKLESLGVLAGGIAHDFNNILAGLYGNISLAKAKLAKDHPEHPGLRYLEAAGNSMNSATLLSGQLLVFAKGGEPVKENLRIDTLIEQIVNFNLSGSNVKPIINPAANLLPARADQGQIQQVFANLTTNAKQAMPHGGHLYIDLENVRLKGDEFPDLAGGDYLLITLTDEGTGIAANHLDRIFDPYFTTKQTGSGLGLATVYSIMQKHGGHVGVSSRLGTGTTFTLYLPAAERAPEASAAIMPPSAVPQKAARVLIMDDEEMIRNIVSDMLEEFGLLVSAAAEGFKALELYQLGLASKEKFDLVILDLTIPGGIGGKEVAKKLLEIDPQAKLVVSSGYADDPVMANPAAYGFVGVIAKPYNFDTLSRLIPRFLGDS
jgi:CheY-like chemotaxis protein